MEEFTHMQSQLDLMMKQQLELILSQRENKQIDNMESHLRGYVHDKITTLMKEATALQSELDELILEIHNQTTDFDFTRKIELGACTNHILSMANKVINKHNQIAQYKNILSVGGKSNLDPDLTFRTYKRR